MKLRFVLGGTAWALLAFAALSVAGDPSMTVPVGLFWAGSAFFAVRGLIVLLKSGSESSHGNSCCVTVCLSKPVASSSTTWATQMVPIYCGQILKRVS